MEDETLRLNTLQKVTSMGLPRWNGASPPTYEWGSVWYRCDDDGTAVLVRRAEYGTYCIAAFATSESFWMKIILEMRRS